MVAHSRARMNKAETKANGLSDAYNNEILQQNGRPVRNGSFEFVAASNRTRFMVRVTAAPNRHTA